MSKGMSAVLKLKYQLLMAQEITAECDKSEVEKLIDDIENTIYDMNQETKELTRKGNDVINQLFDVLKLYA